MDWGDPFSEDEAAKERERRRAERDARRRERKAHRKESQGALGDRVRDLLQRDPQPEESAAEEERVAGQPPPSFEPPQPPPPPPPPPPRSPGDVHRRRRLLALGGLAAGAVVVIVLIALAVRHSGGETSTHMTTQAAPTRMITIPEGYDRRQVAAIAKQEGLKGDYMKASTSSKGFDPAKYGAQSLRAWRGSCSRRPTTCLAIRRPTTSWSASSPPSSSTSPRST